MSAGAGSVLGSVHSTMPSQVTGLPASALVNAKTVSLEVLVVPGAKGPPSFFGKIGQRVTDASPEGGVLVVFSL